MGNAFGDVVYAEKKLLPGVGGRWGAGGALLQGRSLSPLMVLLLYLTS